MFSRGFPDRAERPEGRLPESRASSIMTGNGTQLRYLVPPCLCRTGRRRGARADLQESLWIDVKMQPRAALRAPGSGEPGAQIGLQIDAAGGLNRKADAVAPAHQRD